MKKNKICPKCQSSDIVKIKGTVGIYGMGNNIPTGPTRADCVLVNRYLCCSCGYSEEWINQGDIKKIVESKYCYDRHSADFCNENATTSKGQKIFYSIILVTCYTMMFAALIFFVFLVLWR